MKNYTLSCELSYIIKNKTLELKCIQIYKCKYF